MVLFSVLKLMPVALLWIRFRIDIGQLDPDTGGQK